MLMAPFRVIGADERPPRAEGRADFPPDGSPDGDREVDPDPAVDRPGFELSGIAVGHGHADAAVPRLDIQSSAFPPVAAETDGKAAVGRRPADVAVDVGQRHAAVSGGEGGRSPEVFDGDAAVVGIQRQASVAGYVNLIADVPVFFSPSGWAGCADPPAGLDADVVGQGPRPRLGAAVGGDVRDHPDRRCDSSRARGCRRFGTRRRPAHHCRRRFPRGFRNERRDPGLTSTGRGTPRRPASATARNRPQL